MKIIKTKLEDVLIVEPRAFVDPRGYFMESYHEQRYKENGIEATFVQDNLSYSVQGTLRGLHYQLPHSQAKLVQVLKGEVFDVAVDIRRGSPSFGQWEGVVLSSDNRLQLFIPEGFAHGFCVLSKEAIFHYKCSDIYSPEAQGGVIWNDSELSISWPVNKPLVSDKDMAFLPLSEIEIERLPLY